MTNTGRCRFNRMLRAHAVHVHAAERRACSPRTDISRCVFLESGTTLYRNGARRFFSPGARGVGCALTIALLARNCRIFLACLRTVRRGALREAKAGGAARFTPNGGFSLWSLELFRLGEQIRGRNGARLQHYIENLPRRSGCGSSEFLKSNHTCPEHFGRCCAPHECVAAANCFWSASNSSAAAYQIIGQQSASRRQRGTNAGNGEEGGGRGRGWRGMRMDAHPSDLERPQATRFAVHQLVSLGADTRLQQQN